jgi:hypothetical protein
MNKWVYEPQCCDGECNWNLRCARDAAIRAQREEADEIYTAHRKADLVVAAIAVGVIAAAIFGLMP